MSRIALAQTTSTSDFDANLADCRRAWWRRLPGRARQLLAFPEIFLYLGGVKGKLAIAESLDGSTVSRFREAAARHGMMILLGQSPRAYRRTIRHGSTTLPCSSAPMGRCSPSYRKLKLFDVDLPEIRIKESDSIAPGEERPPVVDTPIGRVGLTICFDLRFSDLYLDLRRRGAQIVCIPSNFTAPTGAAHWEILLRARAVEGQFFVVAPAQTGAAQPPVPIPWPFHAGGPLGTGAGRGPRWTRARLAETSPSTILDQVRSEVPMGM